MSLSFSRTWARTSTDCFRNPRGQVVLQATRPDVGVMQPRARRRLHQRLDHLALDERVEDRGHRAELERVGPQEHQVVQDAVPLGEHRADPPRAFGDLDAREPLDRDHPSELVVERREPVVPVHQHQDLTRVAVLGELLGRPVHVADDRLGADDHLAVELEHDAEHPVGRRVLRPDVEDHLLGPQGPGGTTSMSTPPPRTIQCSAAAVKAARSSVSTGSIILPRTRHGDQPERPARPVVRWPAHGPSPTRPPRTAGPEPRRRIPSLDALLRSEPGRRAAARSAGRSSSTRWPSRWSRLERRPSAVPNHPTTTSCWRARSPSRPSPPSGSCG